MNKLHLFNILHTDGRRDIFLLSAAQAHAKAITIIDTCMLQILTGLIFETQGREVFLLQKILKTIRWSLAFFQ